MLHVGLDMSRRRLDYLALTERKPRRSGRGAARCRRPAWPGGPYDRRPRRARARPLASLPGPPARAAKAARSLEAAVPGATDHRALMAWGRPCPVSDLFDPPQR